MVTMRVASALAVLLLNVQFSYSCDREGHILLCQNIPSYFSPGYLTLVMYLRDFGEINSTMFRSSNLSSVTRLRIDNAGVTGIAKGAFSSFQNLTSLSLNKNAVTQVNSNWFGQPAMLTELSLTENLIEVVNEFSLNGLIGLTKLSLNKNRIKTILANSFISQTNLAELDLSENMMTQVLPLTFRSLSSTTIRLGQNPWDCSCEVGDSVDVLKDLWSRSLLDRPMDVTCESPPALKGQPAWNVSVCAMSPRPPSRTQTVHPIPTGALTTVPASSATSPAQPTSEIQSSVKPKPTESLTTVTLKTATSPPPSETETSVRPKPTDVPITVCSHTEVTEPPSNTNTVCTLAVTIAVLCMLLFVVCFLAVLHRRKRTNKTVMPRRAKEEKNKIEEDSRSSPDQPPGHCEEQDPETAWRRPFAGVRAKSANAVLLMSSFCVSGKDQVTSQNETEAQPKYTEPQAVNEEAGGIQTENLSDSTDITENKEKQADADGDESENPHCLSINTDTVPYLSIGAHPNVPNNQSTISPEKGSQLEKVIGRISTWPPTAIQWQARCKMKDVEDDVPSVWTQNKMFKFSDEVREIVNEAEHPSGSDGVRKEDNTEKNQDLQTDSPVIYEAHKILRPSESSKPNDKTTSFSETHTHFDMSHEEQLKAEEMIQDVSSERLTIRETSNQNQEKLHEIKPAEKPPHKPISKRSKKAAQRNEAKLAATSRQRGENPSSGSKAPSGGASPDDETLLSGNEYAFMDLLHEVVQNNGRWTRERWKQIHINKQRR